MVPFFSVIFLIVIKFVPIFGYKLMEERYEIDVINGSYSKNITVTVSSNREAIIHFDDSISYFPYTVYAWSYDVDPTFPIFIMVRQQKEAISWKIPLLVKSNEGTLSFHNTSRTLCHDNINKMISETSNKTTTSYNNEDDGLHKHLTMSVSTAYDIPTNVTIRVEEQNNFYLKVNQNYSVTISPSEPRFFYYKFPVNDNTDSRGTVILEVESADDTCLTVSIQYATCPVFDLNQDISYEGEYETVNTKGGIIIKETDFPNGFFIVFVAKGDNYDCDKKDTVIPLQNVKSIKPSNHSSVVIFKIRPNISYEKYLLVTISTIAGFLMFYVIFLSLYCEFCSYNRSHDYQTFYDVEDETGSTQPMTSIIQEGLNVPTTDENIVMEPENIPGTSRVEENMLLDSSSKKGQENIENIVNNSDSSITKVDFHQNLDNIDEAQAGTSGIEPRFRELQAYNSESTIYQSISEEIIPQGIDEDETIQADDSVNNKNKLEDIDIFADIDPRLLSSQLYLSDLATNEPNNIHKESINYFLQVICIAIFYGIPVLQLVITHQRIVTITGNLDMCYYNFLCAHPFLIFEDYNHVLSNIGYILLGFLFMIITYAHKKRKHYDNRGIPRHYGLYYAMGTALMMEGILSMCYHVCPNQSNFQFDTSFMYVMTVLCIIKLYQNRHPDINATAHVTFLILAIAVLIAMVGILDGHILVWILFIVLYIVLFPFVAVNIYYINDFNGGRKLICRTRKFKGIIQALKPRKLSRFISITIMTILNITVALLGFVCYYTNIDFGTFLLILLMVNSIMYTLIYVLMKIIHWERFCIQSVLYLLAAALFWGFALHYFANNSSEWMVTPAESRQWNTECEFFDFYDYHDVWHLLSASALFFSFMLLLTLDNELVCSPHRKIAVF